MPKYCDHGAYIPDSAIVASFATNVMTVSSASNLIVPGMRITGAGIPDNTAVQSFGTGTGGAGTYNLTTSPGTLSSRSVTGQGGSYASVPQTFGVPQDGDGVGIDPSTASATVTIDLTGATAAAGATISIAGALLTCIASGASGAQFNAGSGATLAANIAAAINRTTNSALVSAAATGWSASIPIYAACYARVVGNQLQIMFRAGSATHNGLQVVTGGFTGGTFGPYSFSGGVSGCWGMLCNWMPTPFGNLANFGAWGTLGPIAGTLDAGDVIYIRSNDKILVTSTATLSLASSFQGNTTASAPARFVFDTNSVWTGDSPTGHFTVAWMSAASGSIGARFPFASIESQRFSESDYGFTIINNTATAFSLDISGGTYLDGVAVKTSAGNLTGTVAWAPALAAANGRRFGLGDFYLSCVRVNAPILLFGNVTTSNAEVGPGVVDAAGSTVAATGVVSLNSATCDSVMRNVQFRNFVIGSRLHSTSAANTANRLTMIDCDLGNISHRGPYTATAATSFESAGFITSFTNKGQNDFSYDTPRGFCQWNSVYAQPTLNATLSDGVSKWSIVIAPSTVAGACAPYFPFSTPRFSIINSLPTAQRTFTVEIAISDQLAWTKRDVSLWLAYVTEGGEDVVLSTFDPNSGALTTSTSTWSNESGGKVVYVDSGTLLHNKFKLQVTTPAGKPLPLNAEVTAMIRVHNTVSNTSQYLFVDPEIQVA